MDEFIAPTLRNYDTHHPLSSRILDNLMIVDELSVAEGFGFLAYLGHDHSSESMFPLSIRTNISLLHYRYVGNQNN